MTVENLELMTGYQLIHNQILAMLMKKSLSVLRTWIIQAVQIFIPVAFLIIAMLVVRNFDPHGELPALPITLSSYDNPVTLTEIKTTATNYSSIYLEITQGSKVVPNITSEMLELVFSTIFII